MPSDGDGNYWFYAGYDNAHSGNAVWASYSYNSELGALTPDNLLLLPTMDLSGKTLTFWASSIYSYYLDNMGVFFLPDGKEMVIGNLEPLMEWTEVPDEWTKYTIDLGDIGEGQIVFRHFDSNDQYCLMLDDIFVFYYDGVISDYDWVTIDNMTDHPYVITGLDEGAEYEVQMKVESLSWGASTYFTTSNNGISTDLHQVISDKSQVISDEWYTIDGRKLNGMPAKKGIYIQNGQKQIIK